MLIHASCAARDGSGVLLTGPSGSGKSDLLFRLLDRGFALVADDQVEIDGGEASSPPALRGLLEIRGVGIVRLPFLARAPLVLSIALGRGDRLPSPQLDPYGLPFVTLDPACPSAAQRVSLALGLHLGRGVFPYRCICLMGKRAVVVSGLSGAGKASILRALEDIGFNAVDNPPLTLLETLVARAEQPIAIGLDSRSIGFDAEAVRQTVARLKASADTRVELVYAWAEESVLLRRFTETRRRHPMALQGRVADGIHAEELSTGPLRMDADLVIDTSELPLAELRRRIEKRFRPEINADGHTQGLTLALLSFAFPAGLPREADMVFDARFLRNPHYDPILRPRTGLDPAVGAYVEVDPDFDTYFSGILSLLTLVVPRFIQEGKKYATIGIGCTGGRHRSVHIVERLARELKANRTLGMEAFEVTVSHRELERLAAAARIASTDAPASQDR